MGFQQNVRIDGSIIRPTYMADGYYLGGTGQAITDFARELWREVSPVFEGDGREYTFIFEAMHTTFKDPEIAPHSEYAEFVGVMPHWASRVPTYTPNAMLGEPATRTRRFVRSGYLELSNGELTIAHGVSNDNIESLCETVIDSVLQQYEYTPESSYLELRVTVKDIDDIDI